MPFPGREQHRTASRGPRMHCLVRQAFLRYKVNFHRDWLFAELTLTGLSEQVDGSAVVSTRRPGSTLLKLSSSDLPLCLEEICLETIIGFQRMMARLILGGEHLVIGNEVLPDLIKIIRINICMDIGRLWSSAPRSAAIGRRRR